MAGRPPTSCVQRNFGLLCSTGLQQYQCLLEGLWSSGAVSVQTVCRQKPFKCGRARQTFRLLYLSTTPLKMSFVVIYIRTNCNQRKNGTWPSLLIQNLSHKSPCTVIISLDDFCPEELTKEWTWLGTSYLPPLLLPYPSSFLCFLEETLKPWIPHNLWPFKEKSSLKLDALKKKF